jgi:hypothetical protein
LNSGPKPSEKNTAVSNNPRAINRKMAVRSDRSVGSMSSRPTLEHTLKAARPISVVVDVMTSSFAMWRVACLILSRSEICATGMRNRFRHDVTHLVIVLTDWCGPVRVCPGSARLSESCLVWAFTRVIVAEAAYEFYARVNAEHRRLRWGPFSEFKAVWARFVSPMA